MFEIFTMLIRNMLLTGAYQNQVFKDPLSAEEETYYIEKLKNNDNHAREVLIEHNLRLVAHIVKKYSENKDEVSDETRECLYEEKLEWLYQNGCRFMTQDHHYTANYIGPNDMKLARKLIAGGGEHRKFLRQIFVSVDITAPLYW